MTDFASLAGIISLALDKMDEARVKLLDAGNRLEDARNIIGQLGDQPTAEVRGQFAALEGQIDEIEGRSRALFEDLRARMGRVAVGGGFNS